MKQAIIVPYMVDQNEPSTPLAHVFILPDDPRVRNDMLRVLFTQHVFDGAAVDELRVTEDSSYGDIAVSYDDSIFMYVTFVK